MCFNEAPFIDKKGNPYLEVHHVVYLSDDGLDSTENTLALCPNCHTKIHHGKELSKDEQKIINDILTK